MVYMARDFLQDWAARRERTWSHQCRTLAHSPRILPVDVSGDCPLFLQVASHASRSTWNMDTAGRPAAHSLI